VRRVAGQRGRRVLLIDHADAPGKKILISGGGRCNFTNVNAGPEQLPLGQPAFHEVGAAALHARRFHRAGRPAPHRLARKTLGQLFCDGSARQIVAMLLDECAAGGVTCSSALRSRDRACGRAVQGECGRRSRSAGAGHRDRRAVDPQARRDRLRL
jgi:predicted flavoprotein YhiN